MERESDTGRMTNPTDTEASDVPSGAPQTTRRSQVTVQGWILLVLGFMGVLVVIGTVVGSHFLSRTTEVSNYLRDVLQPARVEAHRLQAALISQETGARGYIITADPEFLGPYETGRAEEQDAADTMRALIERPGPMPGVEGPLLDDLGAIENAADEWRRIYTLPLVSNVVPGDPQPVDVGAVEAGSVAFDELRALFEIHLTFDDRWKVPTCRVSSTMSILSKAISGRKIGSVAAPSIAARLVRVCDET